VAVGEADGDAQEVALIARGPQLCQVEGGRVVDAEQGGEVDRAGYRRALSHGLGGETQRGQHACDALGAGDGHRVGGPVRRGRVLGAQVVDDYPVAVDGDAHADLVGLVYLLLKQVQHGDAHVGQTDRRVRAGQFGSGVAVGVADHEHARRQAQGIRAPAGQAAAHLCRVPSALSQVGRAQPGKLGYVGRDPAGGDRAVVHLGVKDVG
jgi:hypothetical protein